MAQVAVGSHDRTLAASGDLALVVPHLPLALLVANDSQVAVAGYAALPTWAIC
jgi:hypothetical protein